jgi:hypothetical protein
MFDDLQVQVALSSARSVLKLLPPNLRELMSSIAELARDADEYGPPNPEPAWAALYDWAEVQAGLPALLLSAVYAVFPHSATELAQLHEDQGERMRSLVLADAFAIAATRADAGLVLALVHHAEARGSADPRASAQVIGGLWQTFVSRTLDRGAAENFANAFRTGRV